MTFLTSHNSESISCEKVAVASIPKEIDATQQQISSERPANFQFEFTDDQTFKQNKELFTLKEILSCNFIDVPFLVKGLIPSECLSLIVGESDLGKSTLHTQLALSIVSGRNSFLGREINAKHKRVLVVSTEEGIYGIGVRIKKQCSVIQPDIESTSRLTFLTSCSDIANKIRKELRKNPVDLVVVDALSDVYHGDINISNKVRIFFNDYANIIREFKCAIIFITHIGKSREGLSLHKNQVLGSVGIVDKARQVIMMTREKTSASHRQLTIIKGNYVSEEDKKKALILEFNNESRIFTSCEERDVRNLSINPHDIFREELINEVVKLRNQGHSYEEIGNRVFKHKSSICRIIQKYPGIVRQEGDPDPGDDL